LELVDSLVRLLEFTVQFVLDLLGRASDRCAIARASRAETSSSDIGLSSVFCSSSLLF